MRYLAVALALVLISASHLSYEETCDVPGHATPWRDGDTLTMGSVSSDAGWTRLTMYSETGADMDIPDTERTLHLGRTRIVDPVLGLDRSEPHHHHYYDDYDSTDIIDHYTTHACLIDDRRTYTGYLPTCRDKDCPLLREQEDHS